MKKIVFVMGFLMIMGVSWAYPSEKVSQKVLTSFKTEFTNAQNVEWETGNNYFRASFTMNEQRIFAYYNVDGQLLSIARYISSIQLPVNLYADLKNLPPALFTVGTADPLIDDTYFMEARWRLAGNKTFLAVYPECSHAFNFFPTRIAAVANGRMYAWITELCK